MDDLNDQEEERRRSNAEDAESAEFTEKDSIQFSCLFSVLSASSVISALCPSYLSASLLQEWDNRLHERVRLAGVEAVTRARNLDGATIW